MATITPSYALGLLFILLVTVIWSFASIVVQYLYTNQEFHSPFLLTYIGTSLFIIFLPTRILWEALVGDGEKNKIPWWTENSQRLEYSPIKSSASNEESLDVYAENNNDTLGGEEEVENVEDVTPGEILSHKDHFLIAMKIAPFWFLSNWSYNASLAYTSITSSTILASTGSLFTFMFALCTGDEKFTFITFMGIICGVTGSVLTGLSDVKHSPHSDTANNSTETNSTTLIAAGHMGTPHHIQRNSDPWEAHALFGDLLGLISAVGYGVYTIMIRVLLPKDENKYSMQLVLGYIGLINAAALLPVCLWILIWDGNSATAQHLTLTVFGFVALKGLFDNVLSDYLWARAVVLTSATVATVGIGLTIPLAFASDWVMGHANVANIRSICGALSVLVGFVLVNMGAQGEDESERNTETTGRIEIETSYEQNRGIEDPKEFR